MSIIKELQLFAKDLSLLIVEDQKDLNQELYELTSIFFKSVDVAFDGVEALKKYKENDYHIILSDITMPNMNGVTLSREIRHISNEQSIIILSAHNELEYLIDLIDIGIHQFIAKPFKEEELFYRLLKVSENIVYKKHYLNTLLNKKTRDDESINEIVEQILDDEVMEDELAFYDDSENFGIINESDNLPNISENNSFKDVVEHKVVNTEDFFKTLQQDKLLWESLEGQIEQLIYLSKDFNEAIERIYLNKLNQDLVDDVSNILRGMYSIFSFIDVLKSLGEVLYELAIFLEELNFSSLNSTQIDKLKILEFIYDDISRFIDTVFVYKDTLDVHYLEDSLRSSVLQLKHNMFQESLEEDELELF